MKKTGWIFLAVIAAIVCGTVFLYTGGNFSHEDAASSSSASEVSSEQPSSSSTVSQSSSSAAEQESSSGLTEEDGKITEKIKAEIPLDWNKYTLKEQEDNPVSIGGVTYRTYTIWDEDYSEGPLVLYNPEDGEIYTYAYSDSAPIPAKEDSAFDKTEHTVTGVIKDAGMMSVLIHTTDGNDLNIRRLGVELVNLDNGFNIGQNVKVTYTGVYQGSNSQRMFVTKIEVIS